jgi:hypothetical protein
VRDSSENPLFFFSKKKTKIVAVFQLLQNAKIIKVGQHDPEDDHRNFGDVEFVSFTTFKNNGRQCEIKFRLLR